MVVSCKSHLSGPSGICHVQIPVSARSSMYFCSTVKEHIDPQRQDCCPAQPFPFVRQSPSPIFFFSQSRLYSSFPTFLYKSSISLSFSVSLLVVSRWSNPCLSTSSACVFHLVIKFGCTAYSEPISDSVRLPLSASNTTRVLNSDEYFFR